MAASVSPSEMNYEFYVESDMSKYIGEWVAIFEGKVIAHGKNIKLVAEEATALAKGRKVLFARVPDKAAMIF
ncbi:succinyl-CoA synthetase subunit alpha [Candidatus Pacearchaeota archaeon]|nr:succinyl-CoA synthetase subunit alpha [Candidatus Pacearchaeota archaeon]